MTQQTNHLEPVSDDAEIYGRLKAPDIFCEGFSQFALGLPTSKLVLHTVVAPKSDDSKKELRKAVAVLSMPTPVLLEAAMKIVAAFKANRKELMEIHQRIGGSLDQMLEQLESASRPEEKS